MKRKTPSLQAVFRVKRHVIENFDQILTNLPHAEHHRLVMSKRRRTSNAGGRPQFAIIKHVRPIDKKIVNINLVDVDSTQQATTIIQATFPCTITGLRWMITVENRTAVQGVSFGWAIVIDREGLTVNTLSVPGNGTDYYTPEGNILAWGTGKLAANNASAGEIIVRNEGTTKTMRKLQQGDVLAVLCRSNEATPSVNFTGTIQFFCKS